MASPQGSGIVRLPRFGKHDGGSRKSAKSAEAAAHGDCCGTIGPTGRERSQRAGTGDRRRKGGGCHGDTECRGARCLSAVLRHCHELDREVLVSAETWHQERDRLVRLLKAIESGKVTHVDEEDLRQLQATNPENITLLKHRLAKLNARLGQA